MSSVLSDHLDEFTLLRFVVGETDDLEVVRVNRHLRSCGSCEINLASTRQLDEAMKRHAQEIFGPPAGETLPVEDPFARRPASRPRRFETLHLRGDEALAIYAGARREAEPLQGALLATVQRPGPASAEALRALDLRRLAPRLALGYTLDASTVHLSGGPVNWCRFALASIAVAGPVAAGAGPLTVEEFAYPIGDLLGRAHTVAGWALNWTGELDRAGEHLESAYESFGRGSASLADLATVELHESQRRSFLERPAEGLILAGRATGTFEALTLDLLAAKGRFAEGLALSYLGRDEEAIPRLESALEPLAAEGLWNAWVSVLQVLGTSFLELGRYAEAKRAYAQALRRASRERHPGVHAFIRHNLGLIHLRRGELAEAIPAFRDAAGLFEAQGAAADSLNATLYLIESLARAGRLEAARSTLAEFEESVSRLHALDPSTLRSIAAALAGKTPDLALLAELREEATATIRRRLLAG